MNKSKKLISSRALYSLLPIVALVVLCLLFGALTDGRFLSPINLKTIFNQAIITGCIATGAVFVFSTNNVNVALGGTTAIAAIAGAAVWKATGSVWLMCLVCVCAGVAILMISCALSVVFKINIVAVTLIMMGLLTALQEWIMMKVVTISINYSVISKINSLHIPAILFLVIMLLFAYVFNLTETGRCLKLIGENSSCAVQTGITINKYLAKAFVWAGIGAGIGAILIIFRNGSVSSTTASGLNLDVMLAIVLGGMPVTGGYRSKIIAGVTGSFIVVVLNSGLLMTGVNAVIIQAVRGVCFLIIIMLTSKKPDELPVKSMT